MGELTFPNASGPSLFRSNDSSEKGRFAPVAFVEQDLPQGEEAACGGGRGDRRVMADPAILFRVILECPH